MSELKVIDLGNIRESIEKDEPVYYEYYAKSEADKVIEEKDEKIENLEEYIKELQKATDSAWSKVNAIYDELRHHKYKRCVAMARWCKSMMVFNSKYGTDKKWHLFKKWRDRWLALAEEPTWAKFLQLIHKEAK